MYVLGKSEFRKIGISPGSNEVASVNNSTPMFKQRATRPTSSSNVISDRDMGYIPVCGHSQAAAHL